MGGRAGKEEGQRRKKVALVRIRVKKMMWCGATSQRNEGKPLETGKKKRQENIFFSDPL